MRTDVSTQLSRDVRFRDEGRTAFQPNQRFPQHGAASISTPLAQSSSHARIASPEKRLGRNYSASSFPLILSCHRNSSPKAFVAFRLQSRSLGTTSTLLSKVDPRSSRWVSLTKSSVRTSVVSRLDES